MFTVPIYDLTKNFNFEHDIGQIHTFPLWHHNNVSKDTLVIVGHNISHYQTKKPNIQWSINFMLCWIGVLISPISEEE